MATEPTESDSPTIWQYRFKQAKGMKPITIMALSGIQIYRDEPKTEEERRDEFEQSGTFKKFLERFGTDFERL